MFFFPLQNRNLRDYARTATAWQFVLSNADCGNIVAILWQFLFRFLNVLFNSIRQNS